MNGMPKKALNELEIERLQVALDDREHPFPIKRGLLKSLEDDPAVHFEDDDGNEITEFSQNMRDVYDAYYSILDAGFTCCTGEQLTQVVLYIQIERSLVDFWGIEKLPDGCYKMPGPEFFERTQPIVDEYRARQAACKNEEREEW